MKTDLTIFDYHITLELTDAMYSITKITICCPHDIHIIRKSYSLRVGFTQSLQLDSIEDRSKYVQTFCDSSLTVIFDTGSVSVFSDVLGLCKLFYVIDGESIYLSDSIDVLGKSCLNKNSYMLMSLMHHHTGGNTVYKNVKYLMGGSYIHISDKITFGRYWSPQSLYHHYPEKIDAKDLSNMFVEVVRNKLSYNRPKNVTLTLTGGYDSRIILAALLKNQCNPSPYTYGDECSIDNIIASNISRLTGLKHYNYNLRPKGDSEIDLMFRTIIKLSSGMATIHRMHRLFAAKQLLVDEPDTEMIFVGHMGGEVMKGIFFDDLITSPYVRRRWQGEDSSVVAKEILDSNFIKYSNDELGSVLHQIDQEEYWSTDQSYNHLMFSIIVKAGLHHSQDIGIYSNLYKCCEPVFLDIDFLELLFRSRYSMVFNEKLMRNPFRRIYGYSLNCDMIKSIYPPLADLPLGKRGMFTPNEYAGNKILLLAKRLWRYHQRHKFALNYSIDHWLTNYLQMLLPLMEKSEVAEFIDFGKYRLELAKMKAGMPEKHWLRFTNIALYYYMSKL